MNEALKWKWPHAVGQFTVSSAFPVILGMAPNSFVAFLFSESGTYLWTSYV